MLVKSSEKKYPVWQYKTRSYKGPAQNWGYCYCMFIPSMQIRRGKASKFNEDALMHPLEHNTIIIGDWKRYSKDS